MTTFARYRLWPAIALLLALTVVTGVIYPLVVTAVAQVAFSHQANGSFVVTTDGRTIGSSLIGQGFSDPKYFWSRPSAAGKDGYDASGSAGSNLGPTNQDLIDRVTAAVAAYQADERERAGPGGSRHDVGVGAGPRHQPRRCRVPGGARREGARHVRG